MNDGLKEGQAAQAPRRRRWGCLVTIVLVLGGGYLLLRQCALADCFERSRSELASPDGKHVARQVGTTCSAGFGNVSDGESVTVDIVPSGWLGESQVFVTFNEPATIAWLGNDELQITVNAVNAINVSMTAARGVRISYRLRDGLNEAAIRAQLDREQRGMPEYLRENARQRFENFVRWAKEQHAL
jgi:hypothetical protein